MTSITNPSLRSRVNVVFNIFTNGEQNKDLEAKFVEYAAKINLKSLKGHRLVVI